MTLLVPLAGAAGIGFIWVDFCVLFSKPVLAWLGWARNCGIGAGDLFPFLRPTLRLWVFLLGVQVALWTAVAVLAYKPVKDGCRNLDWPSRLASIAVVLILFLFALVVMLRPPRDFLDGVIRYSQIPQHAYKNWAPLLGLLAAAMPAAGMAFAFFAARSRQNGQPVGSLVGRMQLVANEQERLKGWLWLVGTIIGAATLGTGAYRNAIIDAAKEPPLLPAGQLSVFPLEYLIIYSLAFSVLVALLYVPTSNALVSEGRGLRDEAITAMQSKPSLLAEAGAPGEWAKARKELSEALGLDKGLQEALTTGIGILGPVIGALLSQVVPKLGR